MIQGQGIEGYFFQILQKSVGKEVNLNFSLTEEQWHSLFEITKKQSLVGLIFNSLNDVSAKCGNPPLSLLYEWIGLSEQIRQQNHSIDRCCKELTEWFSEKGYPSSILKGQGAARLYPEPEARQPGDIDIWVDGSRDDIVQKMREHDINVTYVDYVNCHASFYDDVEVEVHFRPTWMFNPFVNKKVQKWIKENRVEQMNHYDSAIGFPYPSVPFNLVFSLIHIYRHVFFEGIGLRQITDYYFILNHSSKKERGGAMCKLEDFGIAKFAAAVMYVLKRTFNIEDKLMLCPPNVSEGEFLLREIMRGGNFGKYDDRNIYVSDTQRWKRGYYNLKRNLRFIVRYPGEVMFIPLWKVWHWCWRKKMGYLK